MKKKSKAGDKFIMFVDEDDNEILIDDQCEVSEWIQLLEDLSKNSDIPWLKGLEPKPFMS